MSWDRVFIVLLCPYPSPVLTPMCTYPDVLLYILLFPGFRVARILKRFVT